MIQDLRFKNKTKKKLGFSLVELLVVVAIILVLTGIGSYTISRFTQTRNLVKLRDYLSSQIKLARNLAITNQLPGGGLDLKYVKVVILNNRLTVEGVNNNGIGTTESPYFSNKLEISGNADVTESNFGFWGQTGRLTDENGEFSNSPVVIELTDESERYSLSINDLGIISNDD
jgi:prepilin-type N-terminal cleavage/methylation domain-containing protein